MLRLGTSVQDDIVVFGAQVTTSLRIHGLLDLAHRSASIVEPPKVARQELIVSKGSRGGEDPKHRPKGVLELLRSPRLSWRSATAIHQGEIRRAFGTCRSARCDEERTSVARRRDRAVVQISRSGAMNARRGRLLCTSAIVWSPGGKQQFCSSFRVYLSPGRARAPTG